MAEMHPSRETLELFLHGQLAQEETREVIGHLMTDCATCQEITGTGWGQILEGLRASRSEPSVAEDGESLTPTDFAYRDALDRATRRALDQARDLEQDQAQSEDRFRELQDHPHKRRLTMVRNSRRFWSPAFCELLIDKGYGLRFDDAKQGVELTELAVAAAQEIDGPALTEAERQQLVGRAWAYHGNAQRVVTDLRQAERALETAGQCFEQGTGDDLDRALLSRFWALLLRARRDFDGARSRQDMAIRIYQRLGETRLAAQVISDQALGTLYEGNAGQAIEGFEESLQLFTDLGDDRQIAAVRHNLAYSLAECGRFDEALEHVAAIRPVLQEAQEFLSLTRLRWLEGKILSAQDHDERAEEAFLEVQQAFVDEAIGYDAALVCMDLAAVYVRQGRTAEVRQLAEGMVPMFQSRDVHREALAALILFRDAALAESLSLALVERVGSYLQHARNDPKLRFELT